MSSVSVPLADKDLLACPKCGGRAFTRIQTGYTQLVPCEIFVDGKAAVCHYEDEELDEEDDGAQWSRTFVCKQCGHMCLVCYDYMEKCFRHYENELPSDTFWSLDLPTYLKIEAKRCLDLMIAGIEPIRARFERENFKWQFPT